MLSFGIGTLPIMYMGCPLGSKPRRRDFSEPVVWKLQRNMGLWSSGFLLLSDRLLLLKSIMNSVPLYYMVVLWAPIGVAKVM